MIPIRPNPVPCSEESVRLFEQEIGAKLPADYREFLLATNGGWPERGNQFELPGTSLGSGVTSFLALGVREKELPASLAPHSLDDQETIDLTYMDLGWVRELFLGRLPPGLLPVALDPCGNLICMGLSTETYGEVFFWHHESEGAREHGLDMVSVQRIAGSFSEFLRRLKELMPLP